VRAPPRAFVHRGDQRPVERLLGQQDEEFLAAVAVHGVARAALAPEGVVGHLAQHSVFSLVAVTVVERREPIEVAEQHAIGVAVADPARAVGQQILLQPKPVPEPGERIAARLVGERRVEPLKFALGSCGAR
jgi:hypothetical protein